ncbi:MAG: phosphoribosylamine--glycine ligase [Ignavibacterium sp.]|jgi:phosphoribosylamine--glycine ligase|nr:phosphoribosylamine--glycine ligase [Ignavibacterium sp.]
MNVLVIGSGGREHAIALAISKSKKLKKLFCAPGNPGTKSVAENISLNISNHNDVIEFCKSKEINLVVVGPEQPLVDGLADSLRANSVLVFGPSSNAVRIESSKSFAKEIMTNAKVATAAYKEFYADQFEETISYLKEKKFPIVLKADGLAAGKGVIICENFSEAEIAVKDFFINKIFGSSGDKIVIEEFLTGEEASVFAITDGEDFVCLSAAQDHKRIGNNDTGKNTGGMGAYAPAPLITEQLQQKIEKEIIAPTLTELKRSGNKFIGCLYAGLIITKSGPKVIEFNCRFGDPEAQVVLPLIEGDFLGLLYSAAKGKVEKNLIKYSGGCAVCIVAASGGYPDKYEKDFVITGLDLVQDNIIIYHAGTAEKDGKILTNGGRVLGVTSVINSNDLLTAKKIAYQAIEKINFKGMYYRKDISDKALKNIK